MDFGIKKSLNDIIFWFYVLLLVGIFGLLIIILLKYVVKEGFEVDKPYPVYYDMMKGVKYPYSGGPYYHDAPNWFDMWASRNTMWRTGELKDPTYDNVLVGVNATVPMVPSPIQINGNKQTVKALEKFSDVGSSRPYYDNVTSIYSYIDKPSDQTYDWSKMKLSTIPKNNIYSVYCKLDSPADQTYDWSNFKLSGIPDNNTESVYKELVPKC
jgi:hypothetical protein